MDVYDTTLAERFRAALLQRAGSLGHTIDPGHAAQVHEVGDFKDVAAADSAATIDEVQSAHAAAELEEIRGALARIADGSYGQCLDCGDAIDLRRLKVLPAAAYCAACQEVHERARLMPM